MKDLEAANDFRDNLVSRADTDIRGAPLWHGWAIFDAFLAGIDYARASEKKSQDHNSDA